MTVYDATQNVSSELRADIENTLKTHERYKKSYFFRPGSGAAQRRANEARFPGRDYSIKTPQGVIDVSMSYEETCKNVYYSLSVTLDGVKKDIRTLKKLLA